MGPEDLLTASIEAEVVLVHLKVHPGFLCVLVSGDLSTLLLILVRLFSHVERVVSLPVSARLGTYTFLSNFVIFTIF